MNVLEQIELRLASVFSMDKYMSFPAIWNRIAKQLPKLKVEGKHALAIAGRFDIASHQIYGDPQLDWILMVYNGIKRIGNSEGLNKKKTINLTLDPLEDTRLDVELQAENTTIIYGGEEKTGAIDTQGRLEVDLNGDGTYDIRITFNDVGTIDVENLASVRYHFQIVYTTLIVDDYLDAGHEILYPNIDDVKQLLQTSVAEGQEQTVTGFARL